MDCLYWWNSARSTQPVVLDIIRASVILFTDVHRKKRCFGTKYSVCDIACCLQVIYEAAFAVISYPKHNYLLVFFKVGTG